MFRLALVLFALALSSPASSGPRNFLPDWMFTGSALTGFHPFGQADWRAESGEIVGTPKTTAGGWLLLNQGYQDVQFAASFRCGGACTVGVTLRAEKTADGMKGVYVYLAGGERGAYAIKVNSQGAEIGKDRLRQANGAERIAPPPPPPPPAGSDQGRGGGAGGRGAGGGRLGMPGGIASPYPDPPSTELRPNDWNDVEVILDANIVRSWLNRGGGGAAVADDEIGKFGPIALYVGGTGEVRFKDVAVKDLARRITPPESVSARFRMQRIDDFYTGWSAAAGDFNHDGVPDVTAGHRYYLGPDFKESREIYLGQTYNPALAYSPAMVNFAFDYTSIRAANRGAGIATRSFPRSRLRPSRSKTSTVTAGPMRCSSGATSCSTQRRIRKTRRRRGPSTSSPSRAPGAFTASAPAMSTATGRWTSFIRTDGGNSRRRERPRKCGPIIQWRSGA
jgi:hypothetical protein